MTANRIAIGIFLTVAYSGHLAYALTVTDTDIAIAREVGNTHSQIASYLLYCMNAVLYTDDD